MALILITVNDTSTGPAVSIIGEPAITKDANEPMTPAQVVALTMLAALEKEPVLEDYGLVELMGQRTDDDLKHVNVTAAMVDELRQRTDAQMMKCKEALIAANGDIDEAERLITRGPACELADAEQRN